MAAAKVKPFEASDHAAGTYGFQGWCSSRDHSAAADYQRESRTKRGRRVTALCTACARRAVARGAKDCTGGKLGGKTLIEVFDEEDRR